MSTIWTPGGEYVPQPAPAEEPAAAKSSAGSSTGSPAGGPAEPTPEQVQAALAEAQAILAVPVVEHLAGHAMSLFELAALQLEREAATGGKQPVDLAEAGLAIDALAALVEGLGPRLGQFHASMVEALSQLRLAFVRASAG